jgi:hypothetical protein
VSDDGEIRRRLQLLGLELRHEQHERVLKAKERRRAALDRSAKARAELEAALAAPEPATSEDWHNAIAELAALQLLEEGGDVDPERVAQTVLALVDVYATDAEPERAVELFALDVGDLTVDASIAYLRLL